VYLVSFFTLKLVYFFAFTSLYEIVVRCTYCLLIDFPMGSAMSCRKKSIQWDVPWLMLLLLVLNDVLINLSIYKSEKWKPVHILKCCYLSNSNGLLEDLFLSQTNSKYIDPLNGFNIPFWSIYVFLCAPKLLYRIIAC